MRRNAPAALAIQCEFEGSLESRIRSRGFESVRTRTTRARSRQLKHTKPNEARRGTVATEVLRDAKQTKRHYQWKYTYARAHAQSTLLFCAPIHKQAAEHWLVFAKLTHDLLVASQPVFTYNFNCFCGYMSISATLCFGLIL